MPATSAIAIAQVLCNKQRLVYAMVKLGDINDGNNATITTAQKGSYYESVSTEKKSTWWGLGSRTTTITHTNTDLTNTAANINGAGGGGVNINAGNDTTVIGANINGAGGVNIHGGNNTNILAAYDIKEKIDTKTVTSNDFGRFMDTLKQSATNPHITPIHTPTDTYNNNIDSTRTAVLTNINGGSGNVSLTAGNTLNLQAPVINGGSFTYGGGNQTNLLAAIDSREISNTSGGRNFHWQINQSQGSKTETLHMTQVNVPVGMTNYVGAGGISVQLPKGSSLATQIETLSKLPGNEYLVDLANRKDIDWQQVDVINKTWDHKKEGLTQEAAIIVAIVVTIFTAGAASSAGVAAAEGAGFATATTAASTTVMATAGGTAFAAATAAAVTTLATQATIALINSQGDIGAALQEMASEQNLKVLATSVITAGLVQGLGSAFNLPTGTGTSTTLIDKLQTNMVNGVASSLVSTAINGGSLEDNLKAALKNAVITSVAAQGAGMIGDANLDIFSSTLAHAILGCAIGTATTGQATGSGGGCAAGAGGAVVGELAANWYGANVAGATTEDIANFAKLATALVAAGGGAAAMNLAGMTSNNAVVNNYLSHQNLTDRQKELQACRAKSDPSCEVDVMKKYELISAQNTAAIDYNSALTKGGLEATKTELEKALTESVMICDTECKQQAKKSIQEINVALNVIEKTPNVNNLITVAGLTLDIATLGTFAAGRIMSTTLVREYLASRGVLATEEQAAAVMNNFYRDGGDLYSTLYRKPDGKWSYPLNGGAIPGTERMTTLQVGASFDRIGETSGSFISPVGTPIFERSLAPGSAASPLVKYEVLKPIPNATQSTVAPAFGQPGGGTQIELLRSVQWYLDNGYLKVIK